MATTMRRPRKPNGLITPTRTVRIDDDVWARARARAEKEGISVSFVVSAILGEYADGKDILTEGALEIHDPVVTDTFTLPEELLTLR